MLVTHYKGLTKHRLEQNKNFCRIPGGQKIRRRLVKDLSTQEHAMLSSTHG
jgi:hypothetical protein